MSGMKNYVKFILKTYFSKMFSLLLIFFIVSVISSTQITYDVMCVQYVQKQPPEVFFKKGFLKKFANFTRKSLCWSLFLIKLQTWGLATLLKRDCNTDVSCEISTILRAPIVKNICGRLLIKWYVIKHY